MLTHVGVPDKATHWVDGSRFTAPAVSSIAFENSPLDGDTYEFGERIRLAVAFNRTVVASTDVRLALAIGRQTRFADLSPRYDVPQCPPCGFYTQYFEYIVGTGDRDTDGISVPANALRLGDGTTSSAERPRHAWAVPGFYRVSLTVSDGETSSIVSHDVLVEANDPAGTCKPDAETRCLQDSRYEVRAGWWGRDGRSGPARVAHAGTNDSALFWFFDLSNWEILVKVLDGCSTNGHFWVFGAATTDLGYRITVTDTVTGRARAYEHEGGPPAPAITDTTAFHACAR